MYFRFKLNRPLNVAVTEIHGIGKTKKAKFFAIHNLLSAESRKTRLLTLGSGKRRLLECFFKRKLGLLAGPLRRRVKEVLYKQRRISCYKALRKAIGLPCNGQRTKTNARTARIISGVYSTKRSKIIKRRSSIRLRVNAQIIERKRKKLLTARAVLNLKNNAFGVKRKAKDRKKGMKEKLKRR